MCAVETHIHTQNTGQCGLWCAKYWGWPRAVDSIRRDAYCLMLRIHSQSAVSRDGRTMMCVLQRRSIHTVLIPQIAFMSGATGGSSCQSDSTLRKLDFTIPSVHTQYLCLHKCDVRVNFRVWWFSKRRLHALGRQARATHLRWAEYWMWSLQFKAYLELWGRVPGMREQRS